MIPPVGGELPVQRISALYDEVNEPLGLWLGPQPRPVERRGWTIPVLAAPVLVAAAMAAYTFSRQDFRAGAGRLAMEAPAPPPAPVRAAAPSTPRAAAPADPPVAAVDPVEDSRSAKGTANGAGAPVPLIIDVQQALAAQRAKAAPVVSR